MHFLEQVRITRINYECEFIKGHNQVPKSMVKDLLPLFPLWIVANLL